METNPVNFRQEREFGDIINATFTFISQNFKKLMKMLVFYGGPFYLIYGILMGSLQLNIFSPLRTNTFNADDLGSIALKYLLLIVFALLAYVMNYSLIYSYIRLYNENGRDGFELPDVWRLARKNFFMILGTSFVCGLMIVFATLFLIFPGIYISVPLTLIMVIRMIEMKSLGDSISRTFFLVKNKWWLTFGLILVVYLISSSMTYVFMIPQYIMIFLTAFHGKMTPESGYVMTTFTAISSFFSLILTNIPLIAIAFHYFSLVEQKEQPGLLEKIESIGQEETTSQF